MKKFLTMSLQNKAIALLAAILFLILGLNTTVLTGVASKKYKQAMLTKSSAIAEGMQKELGKAVNLGIPVESLEGVNEKLAELVGRDKGIGYAMVTDVKGKILFHNKADEVGKELKDPVTNRVLASKTHLVQDADDYFDLSFPLMTADNKVAGYLRAGIHTREINSQIYELLVWALGISVVCFLTSIILFYVAITKFIARPIVEMKTTADAIAGGDLTAELSVRGEDEVASLQKAINDMAFNLKDMLSKVLNITNGVTTVTSNIALASQGVLTISDVQKKAIEETAMLMGQTDSSMVLVSQSAESLSGFSTDALSSVRELSASIEKVAEHSNVFSETAHETASSIEEMVSTIKSIAESLDTLSRSAEAIASSIDEVNATTKNIDERAHESVNLAEKVMDKASQKGMQSAQAALQGMEEIKKGVVQLSDIINNLGKRTEDIGKILNVIDDVADQTNLLAINAAILASKAGEHGKGFAVVADEIKNLAERTSFSTSEIAELIRSVQDATRTSIHMASEGVSTVDKGLVLVTDVNGALKEIVDSSSASTEMARAIQRATEEESLAIKQITDAVEKMTEQTENISRAIQEQSKGSRFIIDATERVKEMSQQVKNATNEQKDRSRDIADVIENITTQTYHIAEAISRHKDNSAEMVTSMEKIRNATSRLINSSNDMNEVVGSLKEDSFNLLVELKKFKV
ncbi:MAG: HAMP domain-containing protein [Nitrospirae bacterium]|nr:HAMP domain-containing protein [Nitrospirota bacterium]